MKVSIPFVINDCESDCPFWERTDEGDKMCSFQLTWRELPNKFGIPNWCPLKKFEEGEEK